MLLLSPLPLLALQARPLEQPAILNGIAAILSAVAWPILVAAVLFWFRRPIENLVATAVGIAASSSKVKIWQIEFDRDVQQQLEATAHEAMSRQTAVSEHQIGTPPSPRARCRLPHAYAL